MILLDANVLIRMQCFGDASGYRVHLDAYEAISLAALTYEIPRAAARL